jgi:Glyoxalase/Bleomycin resistance protein/Dioxygenase superfamily.
MADERLVFLALWVKDLERSGAFYRDALGVPLHEGLNEPTGDPWLDGKHHEYSWFEGAYFHFALFASRADTAHTTGAEISFWTADVDAKHDELVAKGVDVVHAPSTWDESRLRMARYRDPDGNIVGFTQRL